MLALIGTTGIVMSLTLYAMTTKKDFTMMGGSFFIFFGAFTLFGFLNWFMRSPALAALLVCGSCIIEGFYLIYDVQLICGQMRGKFSTDDYVMAAMNLYIDIIRIFLKLMEILSKLSNDEDKDSKRKKK